MTINDRIAARLGKARTHAATDRWFEIKNAVGPVATVRIYDEIGYWGVTAEDFASELAQITAPEIEVQINSPGGEVFAGIAIYNALRTHPARVTTRIDGIAASIASIIAQAGDHRVMLTGGQMMVHEAWGLCVGNADEMREMADLLDRQCDVLAGIYASRAGGDETAFRDLMRTDKWLTGAEAVELGLADEVVDPERKDAAAALTEERVKALIDEATASLKTPPVTEPVEPTPPTGERVEPEQANALLTALTLKEDM